ncbi:MAG: FAD-dependent oxidoreductase [bacterium]
MKSGKAALISAFVVGGGQICSGRLWAGISFAVLFYGSIVIMIRIWTGFNSGFWGLLAAWVLVWLYNVYDAYKGVGYERPPCEKACPAGIAPWIYVNLVAADNSQPYSFVPFFRILGLICPAPCEDQCTRRGIDAAVAIRYLKSGVKMQVPTPKPKTKKERIAVIGAGPCGLTAAYYLVNKGYGVTVFEREKKPGGVLATLIPEFRLPQSLLDKEIEAAVNVGVELKYGVAVGKDLSMAELLGTYDIIFVATGAWKPTKLGIPGEEMAMVGFDILRQIKKGEEFKLGKIGVIGGGNTAIDIARSLIRQGNEVKIYYRRRIEDMPAEHEDRVEAQEEGIEIVPLTVPLKIEENRVIMQKTEYREGRKGAVEAIQGSEFDVDLDHIVMAIGQCPDTDFLKKYLKSDTSGRIKTKNWRTSHPKIFAGGDAVLGSKTVAHAVGHGLNAAEQIDLYIRGIHPLFARILKRTYYPHVFSLPLHPVERMVIPHREVEDRIHDFKEVELKASKDELKKEATRCLSCPLRYRP